MRLTCPFCGNRGSEEFAYLGDADVIRARPDASGDGADERFHDYVYLRRNPAGPHRELWHHAAGCRAWLVVTRDTRTHEVFSVALAAGEGRR